MRKSIHSQCITDNLANVSMGHDANAAALRKAPMSMYANGEKTASKSS